MNNNKNSKRTKDEYEKLKRSDMRKESKLHLVQLDESILNNWRYVDDKPEILYANIKHHRFVGYLENISCSNLYFESEDRDDLIIIPHSWVKWCVPIDKANN